MSAEQTQKARQAGQRSARRQSQRVGGIRPTQMIHTYGPGAVVDLPNLSVVLGGIDRWDTTYSDYITEPRLLAAVRSIPGCHTVSDLRTPPWDEETASPFDEWARVGVPVYPFPRWLRCTGCNLLAPVDHQRFTLDVPAWRPDRARYYHDRCRGRRPSAVPARFLIACPAGHLDDFPWVEYAHRGQPCSSGQARLELHDVGKANRATDVRVSCVSCDQANRTLQAAFGSDSATYLPRCRGRHPHLHRFDEGCTRRTRAMLLGASNSWFAVQRSALTIPTVAGELNQRVEQSWRALEEVTTREEFGFLYRWQLQRHADKELRWFAAHDADDIWTAICDYRSGQETGSETADLRGPEWAAFTTAARPPSSSDFEIRTVDTPPGFLLTLATPVAVDRLREVQALCGFTRIEGPDAYIAGNSPTGLAPLARDVTTWLPAAEVRGEGVLVRLPEARIAGWSEQYAASESYERFRAALEAWRDRRGLPRDDSSVPTPRYLLLHSLSHLLMHQMALDSGYSVASIRERIYSREPSDRAGPPMAGVLLYTASPDAEGTLGGLVSLAEPQRLASVLRDALERGKVCSSDPMCASHQAGDRTDALHAAACHTCLFAPETSCEDSNRFLDRGAIVELINRSSTPYFSRRDR